MSDISMTTGYSNWLKIYEFFVRLPAAIAVVPRAGAQGSLPTVEEIEAEIRGMEPSS